MEKFALYVLKKICDHKDINMNVNVMSDNRIMCVTKFYASGTYNKVLKFFGVIPEDISTDDYMMEYLKPMQANDGKFCIAHDNVFIALREWYRCVMTVGLMNFPFDSEEYKLCNRLVIFDESEWHLFMDYDDRDECIRDSDYGENF